MTIIRQVARPIPGPRRGVANPGLLITSPADTRRREQASATAVRWRSACSLARTSPWLAAQSRDFVDALLSAARLRDLPAGATVIDADGRETGLHFLVQGCIQLTVPRPHQEVSLAHILLPGEWFGEVSALSGLGSPGEYRARGRCVTLSVPRMELVRLQRRSPLAAAAMLALLAAATRRLAEVVADAAGLDPPGRVISKLLTLSAPPAGDESNDTRSLPVSQFELAELCSVSRATIRKVLGELEARQAVTCSYAEIRVLKRKTLVDALRNHAHGER